MKTSAKAPARLLADSGITSRRGPRIAFLLAVSCLAFACGAPRSVIVVPSTGGGYSPPVHREGLADMEVWPAEVNFGRIEAGGSARQEVSVTNRGRRPVRVFEAAVAGEGFLKWRDDCTREAIPPDSSCRLVVAFTPHRPGVFSGVVRLRLDGMVNQEMEIPLSGRSVPERSPALDATPDRLVFGGLEPGQSKVLEVSVRNSGDADLRFQEVSVEGRGFAKQSDLCSDRFFSPGRSCNVKIAFAPPEPGMFRGSLVLVSNDPRQGRYEVPLEGRGRPLAAPSQGHEGPSPTPDIRAEPERLDFGRVPSGTVKTAEVWVRNQGRADLVIRRATVRGEGFVESQDGCSGRTLSPERSCRMAVSFAPRSGGNFSGALTVDSNAPVGELAVVLGGTGAPAEPEERCRARTVGPFAREESPREGGSSGRRSAGEPSPWVWSDEGTLKVGDCVSYQLTVDKSGALSVCVPPGYALEGPDFRFLKGVECLVPGDEVRYRQYQRADIPSGTRLKDIIVTRGEKGPRAYRVVFRLHNR